jgi:hypothetical protein
MPDPRLSQHSWRHGERVNRRGAAAVSVRDTDRGSRGKFWIEPVVDTDSRLAGGGVGQPGHGWRPRRDELDNFDPIVPIDGRCLHDPTSTERIRQEVIDGPLLVDCRHDWAHK